MTMFRDNEALENSHPNENTGNNTEQVLAEVFANGKITIPKKIREYYGIEDGDFVVVKIVKVVKRREVVEG